MNNKKISFYSHLGSAFGNADNSARGKQKKGRRPSDLRSLSLTLIADIRYYRVSEPDKLEAYLQSQLDIINTTTSKIDHLRIQLEKVMTDNGIDYPEKVADSDLNVTWALDETVVVALVKCVITADETAWLLDVSKNEGLAGGQKIKEFRSYVIGNMKSCYDGIKNTSEKYKEGRSGGLYQIKL